MISTKIYVFFLAVYYRTSMATHLYDTISMNFPPVDSIQCEALVTLLVSINLELIIDRLVVLDQRNYFGDLNWVKKKNYLLDRKSCFQTKEKTNLPFRTITDRSFAYESTS